MCVAQDSDQSVLMSSTSSCLFRLTEDDSLLYIPIFSPFFPKFKYFHSANKHFFWRVFEVERKKGKK